MRKLRTVATKVISLTCVSGVLALEVALAAQPTQTGAESEQVLFLVDDSSSMTEPGFDPARPNASRWELVQEAYPKWLGRLAPTVPTGVVSVGGNCGTAPGISIPAGFERSRTESALQGLYPHGSTNLNAVLESTPSLFNLGIRGAKRIVLLSDGLNTCEPVKSTCEIARDLHAKHGIVIDVVSLVTDPAVEQEFKCVTSASHGNFSSPVSFPDLTKIRFGELDLWPYVVLVLSFLTLALAARILYRQGVHVWRWSPAAAVSAGGILLLSGLFSTYLALFFRTDGLSMLVGLMVLVGIIACACRPRRFTGPEEQNRNPWPRTLLGGAMVFVGLLSASSASAQALPANCKKVAQGAPRYHHIVALDMSGSVARHIAEMKLLVACYATDYALAGEEITLVAFGRDSRGSVKEVQTFTVPASGSTDILNGLLDDLAVQDPKDTRTYYRPLADFLNQLLKRVQLQPIVLVVSDGESDGFQDAASGRVDFREIPFESFGKHGIYTAPGMHGWRVAIDAGSSLDLSALFQHPIVEASWAARALQPLAAVLKPCLVDPQVYFEPDNEVFLTPSWNPADQRVSGVLRINVTGECVTRLRSFKVQWRVGQEVIDVGSIPATPISDSPRAFSLPVLQPSSGIESAEVSVQLLLDQGNSTRVIYPQKNTITRLHEIPYWKAHGMAAGLGGLGLVGVGFLVVGAIRKRLSDRKNHPQFVKPVGGFAVGIYPGRPISIGGEGCDIAVPELPPRIVLAYAESSGEPVSILLHPEPGFQLRVNGRNVSGSTLYSFGHQMQFTSTEGASFELKLFAASEDDVGFGAAVFGKGNGAFSGVSDSLGFPPPSVGEGSLGKGADSGRYPI